MSNNKLRSKLEQPYRKYMRQSKKGACLFLKQNLQYATVDAKLVIYKAPINAS